MTSAAPVLLLEGFSLAPRGPVLTLELRPGDRYAVMGPSASGKSRLLRAVQEGERPAQGSLTVAGTVCCAGLGRLGRRVTPQSLARQGGRRNLADRAAQALSALGLWENRQEPVAQLSPGQTAASELLTCLMSDAELMLIDGQLDRLDPWTLGPVLDLLERVASSGRAVLAATHRADVATRLGSLLVLRDGTPSYVGSVRELLRRCRPAELDVETDDPSTAGAMAEPFAIAVHAGPDGLKVEAEDGQAVAAKLLTLGYGAVRAVVVREPSLEEALLTLR